MKTIEIIHEYVDGDGCRNFEPYAAIKRRDTLWHRKDREGKTVEESYSDEWRLVAGVVNVPLYSIEDVRGYIKILQFVEQEMLKESKDG